MVHDEKPPPPHDNSGRTEAERPTVPAAAFLAADEVAALQTLAAPKRYEVGGLLGEGGMGEVRLCSDLRIGRQVAMKVIRKEKDTPEARGQFFREARVQGQTEHPSIVPVYD